MTAHSALSSSRKELNAAASRALAQQEDGSAVRACFANWRFCDR